MTKHDRQMLRVLGGSLLALIWMLGLCAGKYLTSGLPQMTIKEAIDERKSIFP